MKLTVEQAKILDQDPKLWEIFQSQEQDIAKLQNTIQTKYLDKQKEEAEMQHKQQCKIIALEKSSILASSVGAMIGDTDEVIKQANKMYEWLIK